MYMYMYMSMVAGHHIELLYFEFCDLTKLASVAQLVEHA